MDDNAFMQLATELSLKASKVKTAYCVGAVLVKDDAILTTGYSRELPNIEMPPTSKTNSHSSRQLLFADTFSSSRESLNYINWSSSDSLGIPNNTHAEQCCLMKLADQQMAIGATMYTTMEPCGQRSVGNIPCAILLIDAKIARVVLGAKEPNDFVKHTAGLQRLLDAGIKVTYLPGFEEQCIQVNSHISS